MASSDLTEIKEQELAAQKRHVLRCCMAAGCLSANASDVKEGLRNAVKAAGLEDQVEVRGVGCLRLCCRGPLVHAGPPGVLYERVGPRDAGAIVAAVASGRTADLPTADLGHPFFSKQMPVVLANCGVIDPERIESAIAADAYAALRDALLEMAPREIVEMVSRSGLRGRGGAGFPTGLKWDTVAKARGERKYVVCNADEGDPGAFMDRSILESDPHSVLEGMAIAAYAVGADQGYIYIRAEYPLAISRVQTAIRQAKLQGLLGSGILESPFNFNVDIRHGAGAYVCGEETALLMSIEGKRGTPRPRPPYPAESGLWECPTLINNVETFANVPPILRKGAEWFAGIGTEKSKGTKVFALAGKVRNTGLVEVPMGTRLRDIVEEMGGGAPDGAAFKAVQTGGPSGGCIPAHLFDTPVDYESLTRLGTIMGSGGMIAMDGTTNMVDMARYFLEFCVDESCGRCVPCRAGTVQMHRLLTKIAAREGTSRDIALLEELCDMVKNASLCGLGQNAPNPVLSTLRYFRDEYEALLQPAPSGSNGSSGGPAAPAV